MATSAPGISCTHDLRGTADGRQSGLQERPRPRSAGALQT